MGYGLLEIDLFVTGCTLFFGVKFELICAVQARSMLTYQRVKMSTFCSICSAENLCYVTQKLRFGEALFAVPLQIVFLVRAVEFPFNSRASFGRGRSKDRRIEHPIDTCNASSATFVPPTRSDMR